jgi:hypothetical protein
MLLNEMILSLLDRVATLQKLHSLHMHPWVEWQLHRQQL